MTMSADWTATRFVFAQSWWLASELVRRHPELIVHEMHPGGGMYDVLCVVAPGKDESFELTRIMLNRAGSIQVHHPQRAAKPDEMVGTWKQVMVASDPHEYVKRIEAAAGLGVLAKAPPSTPRALAYRFISTALTMLVNDRHRWDARNEFLDSSGMGGFDEDADLRKYLSGFPDAIRHLSTTPSLGHWREPYSHFWALLREDEPVAIVSIEGRLYLPDRVSNLAQEYQVYDRNMHAMVVGLLLAGLK